MDLTFDSQVSKHGEQRKDINATVSSCVIMTFHQCTMEKNICVVVVKELIFSGVEVEFYEVRTIMPPIVTTRPIFLALCVDLILKAYPQSFPPTPSIFAEVEEEKMKDSQ